LRTVRNLSLAVVSSLLLIEEWGKRAHRGVNREQPMTRHKSDSYPVLLCELLLVVHAAIIVHSTSLLSALCSLRV